MRYFLCVALRVKAPVSVENFTKKYRTIRNKKLKNIPKMTPDKPQSSPK